MVEELGGIVVGTFVAMDIVAADDAAVAGIAGDCRRVVVLAMEDRQKSLDAQSKGEAATRIVHV